jgi:hypothetical protein
MDIDEWEEGQESDVCGVEERVRDMRGYGCAEEDLKGCKDGDGDEG